MNEPRVHAVFEDLLLHERADALPAQDAVALHGHLAGCERCRQFSASLDAGLVALASRPIAVPARLTAATRLRVRQKAAELAENAARLQWIAAASALACAVGMLTASALWLGVEWLGRHWGAPLGALVCVFVVVWFVPATLGGLVVAWARSRHTGAWRAAEERQS